MIAKGCTCRNTFTLPFLEGNISSLVITYKQRDKIVLEKTKEQCTFDGNKVSVDLTQEETLLFDEKAIIRIQIKVKTTQGDVVKSNIMETYTDEVLNSGVI